MTLIRTLAAVAAALVLTACHAKADEPTKKSGCYVESSGVGKTNATPGTTNTISQIGVGVGCEAVKNGVLVGGGVRLDMGSGNRDATVYGKAGVSLNATGTSAYGLMGYNFDASNGVTQMALDKGGVVVIGGGIEQKITDDLAGFAELQKDLLQIGAARGLDPQYTGRVGVRARF